MHRGSHTDLSLRHVLVQHEQGETILTLAWRPCAHLGTLDCCVVVRAPPAGASKWLVFDPEFEVESVNSAGIVNNAVQVV